MEAPLNLSPQPYISPNPPPQTIKPARTKRLLFLSLVFICLIAGGIFPYRYITDKNNRETLIQPQTSENSTKVTPTTPPTGTNWLIYTKFSNNQEDPFSTYDVFAYNLDTRTTLNLTEMTGESPAFVTMGRWSPDGRYLPFSLSRYYEEMNRERSLDSLYFFDATSASLIHAIAPETINPKLPEVFLEYTNQWLDLQTYSFTVRSWDNPKEQRYVKLNLPNKVEVTLEQAVDEKKVITSNHEVTLTRTFQSENESVTELLWEGKSYSIPDVKGFPIGFRHNYIILIDNLYELTSSEWYSFTINWHPIGDVPAKAPVTIQTPDWISISTLLHPITGKLLVLQNNMESNTNQHRLIEVDMTEPHDYRIVMDLANIANEQSIGHYSIEHSQHFMLSNDGNWLIAPVESADFKSIGAWNLNTQENHLVCEDACLDIRLFNPHYLSQYY
jgi:hypothetical protein